MDFHRGTLAVQLPGSAVWTELASGDSATRWRADQAVLDFTVMDGNGSVLSLDRGDGRPAATLTRRQ